MKTKEIVECPYCNGTHKLIDCDSEPDYIVTIGCLESIRLREKLATLKEVLKNAQEKKAWYRKDQLTKKKEVGKDKTDDNWYEGIDDVMVEIIEILEYKIKAAEK